MKRQNMAQNPDKKTIYCAISTIVNIVLICFIIMCAKSDYLYWVAVASTVIFFASLYFFYSFSKEHDFNTAEIRRSIAVTFVVCYFLLLSASDKINVTVNGKRLIEVLLGRFDYIILAIVGFYFGGRSIEKATERLGNPSKKSEHKEKVSK